MTDLPPLAAVPDPDDAGELDPADLAVVARALDTVSFLRPPGDQASPGTDETDIDADPMPLWVWERLHTALAAESAGQSAGHERGRGFAGRTRRWTGGLVAASLAVVAVGVALTVLRPGGGQILATVAEPTAAAKVAAASAFAAPADAAADTASAAEAAVGGGEPAPAARMVLDSHTDYRPASLRDQVTTMVKTAGFSTLREAQTKQPPVPAMPVADGFTTSWQRLRDCVTWLTQSEEGQALVVDRGTFAGADAGVVVAPSDPTRTDPTRTDPSTGTAPAPTASLATPTGTFDVWVVDPQCDTVAASLDDFALYSWQP